MTFRALRVAALTAAQRVVFAPSAFIVSMGIYGGVVAILGSLWRTAASANHGFVAGYTGAALTWYIAASEAATIPLNTRLIEMLGDDIASGAVAAEMLRPASVVAVRIASEIGRTLPHLALCLVAGTGLCWWTVGAPPNLASAALVPLSVALAITCNVVAQHAFAAVSFWIRDARSTWFIYQKFVFVIGGMLLPLEVLPHAMTTVAKLLPFMAMAYAPARLASGHFEPWLLLVQVGWITALACVAAVVFRSGERRLQVVGG
ncbi:MAG: viologen exporter family transport system permease protein [Actinomycetota bacterium]|jgi:ABC-2 type transport system permease protein